MAPVELTQPAAAQTIERILLAALVERLLLAGIVNALRPRIVRDDGEAPRHALVDLGLKAVVTGVRIPGGATEAAVGGREAPARIGIRGRRKSPALGVDAGNKGRGIELVLQRKLSTIVAHEADLRQPTGRDLPLDGEAQVLDVGGLEVADE